MQGVEERLEMAELLKDPEFGVPLQNAIDGFGEGNVNKLVQGGRAYMEGTDTTDPKKGIRRYENYRFNIDLPNRGICRIGIDPLLGEKGFTHGILLESNDVPVMNEGLYEGLVNWFSTINLNENQFINIHELFNSRGAIQELVCFKTEEERSSVFNAALKAGYTLKGKVVKNGFVFSSTEKIYLARDFVDPLNTLKPFLNTIEITHTVKLEEVFDPDDETKIPEQNWSVNGQAKFYIEDKQAFDLTDKDLFSTIRKHTLEGSLPDKLKNLATVSSETGISSFIIGREVNPRLILSYDIDQEDVHLDTLIVNETVINEFFNLSYHDLKDRLKPLIGDDSVFELLVREDTIEIGSKNMIIKMALANDKNPQMQKGVFVIFRSN